MPPKIAGQPQNVTVPMGLTAIFSVVVSGDGTLQFQWSKDGAPISGARASYYTTASTTFADTGSVFTVTVSNSLGAVTSNPATLTVGARAPAAGDLRFQQVDAASTVNGYGNEGGLHTLIEAITIDYASSSSTGTPLSVGPGCAGGGSGTPIFQLNCGWAFSIFNLPEGVSGLTTGYYTDYLSNLQADLTGTPGGVPAIVTGGSSPPNTVVTAIDIEPVYGGFAASWIQTSGAGGFTMAQHTIAASDLQAAGTSEGQQSRVITAISYDAGQIYYISYGWQSDTSTIYEVQTATATFSNVGTVASNLAAEGYILTAIGGTYADGIVLVGTRVRGDTLPRPIMLIPEQESPAPLFTGGYAPVAYIIDPDGYPYWIGER